MYFSNIKNNAYAGGMSLVMRMYFTLNALHSLCLYVYLCVCVFFARLVH